MPKKLKIPGLSFSWKRAIGVTKAKRRVAKSFGIPTTRSGRRRKAGRMLGCALPVLFGALGVAAVALYIL